ncbi:HlyD family efflux transporter periplasmic adaptor subunit [Parasulfuritortus cantonensis]|uniref:HlyD family efflux transporter periplasmic adaptor subunit n=1 Tax=Parasulfuritortus cantonensis TaxID=2528202 RepID=A0A4R1B112_9PROT|nr:HlyD family efflux transporter periplasmic adaptor subunit [Parasulfuritortus cantonensis]TCJ11674.1 HlyD family efflux transporter periplasmic adaptor subunit [Parasulfuritortus cantonensis]
MNNTVKTWLVRGLLVALLGALAGFAWLKYRGNGADAGLASGNGRIEATEIDIASKFPGRVKEIRVGEGDFVKAGEVVAAMDTESLDAQLNQAEAQLRQAESSVAIAQSQLGQRRAEKAAMLAVLAQRQAELEVAHKRQARSSTLAKEGASSQQEADDDNARVESATAAVSAARAQVAATEAAITTAEAQVTGAGSTVAAARASVARIRADLDDATLKAPRDGRVQYRVVQPGEVIGAGGRVLNMVDLSDVYMTFFLPTAAAGKLALGDEVHLVLDAAPQYVVPARVSYVADVAQFTPKTVETAVEREKLMFRVKARIDPALLKQHIMRVKTGLPGMAYVRVDKTVPWPDRLALKPLPQ